MSPASRRSVRPHRTERPILGGAHLTDTGAPMGGKAEGDGPRSDLSLLAGLAARDADLEAAFVQRFQGRVYGLARLLVGESHLAEDVAQQAFLWARHYAPNFDPRRGSVTTWLHAITRNLAIDALRPGQAVPVKLEVLMLEPDSQGRGPDEATAASDAGSNLREAIRHLPPEECRALVLAFFYGQTAREISITERIPLGTARTRIRLGMTNLRAALDRGEIRPQRLLDEDPRPGRHGDQTSPLRCSTGCSTGS